jgi:hypothetical protein
MVSACGLMSRFQIPLFLMSELWMVPFLMSALVMSLEAVAVPTLTAAAVRAQATTVFHIVDSPY